ncbi:hypothetical protein EBH_0001420 [Eimeria brunetti]|uniref:Uncharacterized protein n=1 Tax=Eimeria brunetti TaxID=51314 RepID=U6LQX2_9EIME|nr:hypothetical protein EBH_0001420 [Eimeria brunetti]
MLPSVLNGKQQAAERRDGTTLPFSNPHKYNEESEELPLKSVPWPHKGARPRSRARGQPLLLYLTCIIAVAAFLVFFSVCKVWHSRRQVSGAADRRLADDTEGVDNDDMRVIEDCLALEADLGLLEQRATSHSDADELRRVEGLVSALRAAAVEHEATQGVLLLPFLQPPKPPPYTYVSGPEPDRHRFKELRKLLISFQPDKEKESKTTTAQPSTSSMDDDGPMPTPHVLTAEARLDGALDTSTQEYEQEEDDVKPLISGLSGGGEPSHSADKLPGFLDIACIAKDASTICNHPYVWLPEFEEGVVVRDIDVDHLFDPFRKKMHPHFFLLSLRKLFAQRVLGQADASTLVNALEGLIGASWYQAQMGRRGCRPVFAATALAKSFLAFDAIVSCKQLLGDHMRFSLWWDKFTSVFKFVIPMAPRVHQYQVVNRRLLKHLHGALETYKKGERPELRDVIELKMKLFCSPNSPAEFRKPKWDPWREDGETR